MFNNPDIPPARRLMTAGATCVLAGLGLLLIRGDGARDPQHQKQQDPVPAMEALSVANPDIAST